MGGKPTLWNNFGELAYPGILTFRMKEEKKERGRREKCGHQEKEKKRDYKEVTANFLLQVMNISDVTLLQHCLHFFII